MVDLIILTSCIKPQKQKFLRLQDSKSRYEQTIDCLKHYINSNSIKNIVLCDGSGFDLSSDSIVDYACNHNVNLETLSFYQDFESIKEKGKGYGEGEIMQYVINNSLLYKRCSTFIKITGRLIVNNISDISQIIVPEKNTYFNIIPSLYLGCVDTRVYSINKNVFETYFSESYKEVNEKNHKSYEYCFTDVIKNKNIRISPFPIVPIILGFSGTQNKRYKKDVSFYVIKLLTSLGIMNTRFAALVLLFFHIPEALSELIKNKGKR